MNNLSPHQQTKTFELPDETGETPQIHTYMGIPYWWENGKIFCMGNTYSSDFEVRKAILRSFPIIASAVK